MPSQLVAAVAPLAAAVTHAAGRAWTAHQHTYLPRRAGRATRGPGCCTCTLHTRDGQSQSDGAPTLHIQRHAVPYLV